MNGINFIEPLFYATIKIRKKQTRRILKPQPQGNLAGMIKYTKPRHKEDFTRFDFDCGLSIDPRYKVGETLFLREPYKFYLGMHNDIGFYFKFSMVTKAFLLCDLIGSKKNEIYDMILKLTALQNKSKTGYINKLFVPKLLQNIFPYKIKITAVRCERLQDISDEDCFKEGIINTHGMEDIPVGGFSYDINSNPSSLYSTPKDAYAALINKINGHNTWESNPYVVVYDYELVRKPFEKIEDILKRLYNE